MSNNTIIVNIQNPCDEKWSKMQPHDRGKFCMQCSKEVIDFTKFDNSEIVRVIEQSNVRICGRFNVNQLNKELTNNKVSQNNFAVKGFVSIFLIGSVGNAFASKPLPFKNDTFKIIENKLSNNKQNIQDSNITDSLEFKIEGQILNEYDEPITDAIINVKELYISVKSDTQGNFSIILPQDFSLDFITLNIEHEYFVTYSIRVFKKDLPIERKFYLNEEVVLMGDIMITYKPKWWQFWKRF